MKRIVNSERNAHLQRKILAVENNNLSLVLERKHQLKSRQQLCMFTLLFKDNSFTNILLRLLTLVTRDKSNKTKLLSNLLFMR